MTELAPIIDFETLISTLFTRDMPDIVALDEYDEAFIDDYPAIRYSFGGLGQASNGPNLFNVTLTWNVVGTKAAAWAVMARSYSVIHAWPLGDPVTDVGWVANVTDEALPSKTPTPDLADKSITQYAAQVALVLRT